MNNRFQITVLTAAMAACLLVVGCNRSANDSGNRPQGTAPSGAAPAASAPTPPTPLGSAPGTPAASGPVSAVERVFVTDAASSGMAEVEGSRTVSGKTTNSAVKTFAEAMVRDHTAANDELQRIAGAKGITLPSTPEGEAAGTLSGLNGLSGVELDRAYVQTLGLDAHAKAIALFERQAKEGQDAELKAFAERTLPKLREHRTMAEQLQRDLGTTGAASGAAPKR